jgi:hypothetical protein
MKKSPIIMVVVLLVIVLGLLRSFKVFANPVDCMPKVISDGQVEQQNFWEKVLGTKCVSW